MNYHRITEDDISNGDGVRVVLWVSGCTHKCKGCHNPETHPFKSGIPFTKEAEDEIMKLLEKEYYSGLTLSGGDPFHPNNASRLAEVAARFKLNFPNKDLWVWTGYTYEELLEFNDNNINSLLYYTDVLVDGKFDISKAALPPKYRGSSNQRLLYLDKGGIIKD